MDRIRELIDWLQALPADFAFLLALPFVVGAAGLAAEWVRRLGEGSRKPRVVAAALRKGPIRGAGTGPRCAPPASPH